MPVCCPAGHGCNSPGGKEPCALTLLGGAAPTDRDAAKAMARWGSLMQSEQAGCGERERRFRRRAFERARNRALIGLAMGRKRPTRDARRRGRSWQSGGPRPPVAHPA